MRDANRAAAEANLRDLKSVQSHALVVPSEARLDSLALTRRQPTRSDIHTTVCADLRRRDAQRRRRSVELR